MQSHQQDESTNFIIFGYGSLIWKPNFAYQRRLIGYIQGYQRRFYQGNVTHRGTRERPGRVATLIPAEKQDERVWGCAYEVVGQNEVQAALEHLNEREVINGGYEFVKTDFYPIRPDSTTPHKMRAWVCVHVSTPQSFDHISPKSESFQSDASLYLGEAPLDVQASQIASACGTCGFNSEYLFRIATFMRTEVPTEQSYMDDPYLFHLERLVRKRIACAQHLSIDNLDESCVELPTKSPHSPLESWNSILDKDVYGDHLAPRILSKTLT